MMNRVTNSVLGVTSKLIKNTGGKVKTHLFSNNEIGNQMMQKFSTSGLQGKTFISNATLLNFWKKNKTTRKTFKSIFEDGKTTQNIINFDKKTLISDGVLKYLRIFVLYLTAVSFFTTGEWVKKQPSVIFHELLMKYELMKENYDDKTSAEAKKD